MKLLIIRHGAAMDQEEFAQTKQSDDLRPLTGEGKREMKRVAKGLRKAIDELDVLATSPLVRAVQTAEIVADAYGIEITDTTPTLVPDAPLDEFEEWCGRFRDEKVIAVVGHEPHLSSLATWLMTGRRESRIRLKKAGACLLEFDSAVRRDSGTLNWLLTPRQLAENTG
jgi:phosphohistidine phosphatase